MHSPPAQPLVVLVPLKPLALAKGRLAAALGRERRRQLVAAMLAHVLDAVRASCVPGHVVVVAGDGEAAALARALGVEVLAESEGWRVEVGAGDVGFPAGPEEASPAREVVESPLNRALSDALAWADASGYEAALILPADLPRVTPQDVDYLWREADAVAGPVIVLAPDAQEEGTNALLLRPPQAIPPSFGRGSFRRHVALARSEGVPVRVCRAAGLLYDVDEPGDLDVWHVAGTMHEET